MRIRLTTVWLALVIATVALGACGGDDDGDGGGGGGTPAERWKGEFDSSFGELTFSAAGGRVTGRYEYCGGQLTGTPKGNRLTGTWREDPAACEENEQRGPTTDTTGSFEFKLAADGSSFEGTWRYADGSVDPAGDSWTGTRVSD